MVAKKKEASVEVVELNVDRVEFCLLGITPFICHSMSAKVMQELLLPKGRKSAADKAHSLKHNPYQEYRDSPYINPDKTAPAYIEHLSTAFKQSIRGAAVDMPGSSKAQLGRMIWCEGERIPIFGLPKLFMSVTRSADMNKTPDVRTRAIIPNWACKITINYIKPVLTYKVISSLLGAAGFTQGMGDWRPQKGSGNYGQFTIVNEKDKKFQEIIKSGGWQPQFAAMQNPVPYDAESEKLLGWFDEESDRRGLNIVGGKA